MKKHTHINGSIAAACAGMAALTAFAPEATAADRTVSPGQSIAAAINASSPGDRVLVRAGSYGGGAWIQRSGTASAPITVLSVDGPRAAVISGGSESLRVGASAYLEFDGFEVSNSGNNTIHIDNSHHITLRNMYGHDAGFNGDVLKMNQSDHMTIERSEFARPGARDVTDNPYQECLDFVDVDDSIVRDNWIHDGGSMLMFVKGGSRNTIIERNVYSQQRSGASDPAVGLGGPTDPSLLEGEQYEGFNIIFRNNIIMNAPTGAIAIYDVSGAFVANNLLLNNGRVLIEFRAGNGPAGGTTNVKVVNNVMVDTRGAMPTPYRLSSHTLSNFSTSNNLFWNAGNAIPASSGTISATGQPGHLVADPLVAVPAAAANRSTVISTTKAGSGSPATGSGIDGSASPFFVVDDINAIARVAPYDRGPHKLSGTATSPTPTPTPTPTPSTVTSVAYTASPTPGVVNQPTVINATSVGSTSPVYHYWVVTDTGVWTEPCGGYTPNTSCRFTPTTVGSWQIAVSARDVNSTANYDATSGQLPYLVGTTTTDPAPAPSPEPTPTPTPTPTPGTATPVTSVSVTTTPAAGLVRQPTVISATSVGSASPQYLFSVTPPRGGAAEPCGGYSVSASCTFTPNKPGTWTVSVSARDANSTASYDAQSTPTAYQVER